MGTAGEKRGKRKNRSKNNLTVYYYPRTIMTSRYIFREKSNQSHRYHLYINVFELEHGCYAVYAMRTNIREDAIAVIRHFNDPWIEEHPILQVYDVFDYICSPNESYFSIETNGIDPVVLRYMYMYSYQNVRGGSYCNMDLTHEQRYSLKLLDTLKTDGRCICGQRGHDIMECDVYECYHCKEYGHFGFQCKKFQIAKTPPMALQPVSDGKVRCLRCQTWQSEKDVSCSECQFSLKYLYNRVEHASCPSPLSCSP